MSENWKTYKLEDILKIKNGKRKPKEKGEFPIYGGNGILGYGNKTNLNEEAILIGRVGAYCGAVYYENREIWVSDNSLFGLSKTGFDTKFLYYLLKQANLNRYATGSSQPLLTQGALNVLNFVIPASLSEQKAIASILSALDDKIEINLQMNKTLESMAMALYKHWFVDFGPFRDGEFVDSELGEIPNGWEVKQLSDILEIKYGKDHKKLDEGNIPCYGTGGIMRFVDKFLYDKDSILIPRKGSLNKLYYMTKPFWTVDTLFYSKIKIKHFGKYAFHFLKSTDLASMDVGSAVPSLTTQLLNRINIVKPPIEEIEKFDKKVTRYFDQMEANISENKTLTKLRDTLLPKLISGEVRVKDIVSRIREVKDVY